MLNGRLDWPGAAQVFERERVRLLPGKAEVEVVHGVTGLPRERADAGRRLALARGHWGIENRLHHVRDETLGEDRRRVRRGAAARVLTAVRNVAVYLPAGVAAGSQAAAARRFAARPREALPLLLT
jgi:hypothetical protein